MRTGGEDCGVDGDGCVIAGADEVDRVRRWVWGSEGADEVLMKKKVVVVESLLLYGGAGVRFCRKVGRHRSFLVLFFYFYFFISKSTHSFRRNRNLIGTQT